MSPLRTTILEAPKPLRGTLNCGHAAMDTRYQDGPWEIPGQNRAIRHADRRWEIYYLSSRRSHRIAYRLLWRPDADIQLRPSLLCRSLFALTGNSEFDMRTCSYIPCPKKAAAQKGFRRITHDAAQKIVYRGTYYRTDVSAFSSLSSKAPIPIEWQLRCPCLNCSRKRSSYRLTISEWVAP